jgi:high-affinity iron transporter
MTAKSQFPEAQTAHHALTSRPPSPALRLVVRITLVAAALLVLSALVWQGITASGNPNPAAHHPGSVAGILDIGVLVFREGLECVLVLSAITAGMAKAREPYQRPVAAGVGIGFLATLITWFVAVSIVDDLTKDINALYVQAGTGLLAIIVLLVVMNWFFHKIYWTGWISLHNRRKHELIESAAGGTGSPRRLLLGMGLLGFTSFYREGVEVVLFLQSYRLKLGGESIFYGVLLGLMLTGIVAILTFLAHRKLPYRRMLILTGALLGVVLLVMVGEQAQEMQLAHWLPVTVIPALASRIPAWMGLWFSVFPTVQTLAAQVVAAAVVLGSYAAVRT